MTYFFEKDGKVFVARGSAVNVEGYIAQGYTRLLENEGTRRVEEAENTRLAKQEEEAEQAEQQREAKLRQTVDDKFSEKEKPLAERVAEILKGDEDFINSIAQRVKEDGD